MNNLAVTFWNVQGELTHETECATTAEQIIALIDMIDTVKAGGYCLSSDGGHSLLITNIKQLCRICETNA